MARATTKTDLITAAQEQFDKMWQLIDSMTVDEQTARFNFEITASMKEAHWERDRNLRDVLVHLYEWHLLLLNWVESNQQGQAMPFIPEPWNWKSYGQMNQVFWKKHQATSPADAKTLLKESHTRVMKLIDFFSNTALFSKGHFPWTGTGTLGSYCVSATSSHYDWAIKKLKKHHKSYAG